MRAADATLASGTRLGRYEIVSFIAAGGMGEVYQAHDSRLNRRVAVKVLPAAHDTDRDRLSRFEKEARSASRLAHPNIVSVYDFGEQDHVPYIVTEFLDGRTLAEMLGERQMPMETILDIATQAARGLAAAHEKRIVHRDLKPANIFVTTGGEVKILDFGLAKLTQDEWQSATSDETITRPGEVMGSSAYMSPEQVQGAPVDIRSDVFSFGSVLYEMVTGHRPFEGRTAIETLTAILRDDPPAISRPDCGADLVAIVNRCLQKRPDARFGSASELLFALKQITIGGVVSRPQRVRVRSPLVRTVSSVMIVAFLTLLVSGAPHRAKTEIEEAPAMRMVRAERLTTSGTVRSAILSPDRAYLAYSMVMRDHEVARLRHLASGSEIELVPFRENRRVTPVGFSPDGNHVYLRQYTLVGPAHLFPPLWEPLPLVRIPLLGGTPEVLSPAEWASSLQFAPNGNMVAFIRWEKRDQWSQVVVADPTLRHERVVAEVREGTRFPAAPAWSSDSRRLMVAVQLRPEASDVPMEIDVAAGTVRRVSLCPEIKGPVAILRAPDGGWIAEVAEVTKTIPTFAGRPQITHLGSPAAEPGILWHVSPDGTRCQRITDGTMYWNLTGATSDDSAVVAVGRQALSSLWRYSPNRGQTPTRLLHGINTEDGLRSGLATFGDGRAVITRNASGKIDGYTDLWILEQGETLRQVTDDAAVESHVAASPDGQTIAYFSTAPDERKNPRRSLWVRNVDTGEARSLVEAAPRPTKPSFSPDGEWVYFLSRTTLGAPAYLQRVPTRGGAVENVGVPVTCDSVRLSPDGRYISCREGGAVSILSMIDGRLLHRTNIPREAQFVRWLPDSSALAYAEFTAQDCNIFAVSIGGGQPRRIAQLPGEGLEGYAFTPDGGIVYTHNVEVTDAFLLHLETKPSRKAARR